MAKVKVKTLIGSVVAVAFFLTVIVAFLFYAFPEKRRFGHWLRSV